MVFDINLMKSDVVATLKDYLLPEQQAGATAFAINSTADNVVLQSFKPYSTGYRADRRSFSVEINVKKTGSPTGSIEVYLLSDNSGTPSNTITGRTLPPASITTAYADVQFFMDFKNIDNQHLGSDSRYWIEVKSGHTVDASHYYSLRRSVVDTGYMMGTGYYKIGDGGTLIAFDADINFRVSLPTWIFPDYPYDSLSDHSYPRVAVDLVGRPRVEQPWVNHKMADYKLNIGVTYYSRYPKELDDIISYGDRALWYERASISSFRILTPGNISTAVMPKEGLFVKTVIYQVTHRELAEGIS